MQSMTYDGIDLCKFCFVEIEVLQACHTFFDLTDSARTNQCRGHPFVPQDPREGHLCERLPPLLRQSIQLLHLAEFLARDLIPFQEAVRLCST